MKKVDAWKTFHHEIKDKRSSEKKRTLLYLLSVFLVVV